MYKKVLAVFFGFSFIVGITANAACDCGSTDQANPCRGNAITVRVVAGTPNGGTAVDNVYNWSFNSGGQDATCGRFANGDYWVAPAPGQSSVSITGITGSGNVSADVDPTLESMGLLSGVKNYGNYNAAENIIPRLPMVFNTVSSVVAATQRNEAVEGNCGTAGTVGECSDSYDVLTVLTSVPANNGSDMIRPNITGKSKEFITFSDLDLARLPSLALFTGTTAAGLESMRSRWSHSTEIFGFGSIQTGTNVMKVFSEGGRAFRSHTQIDDYGAGVATQWNNDMATLFSDDNALSDKKAAIAAMMAYGLDIYHNVYDAPVGFTRVWVSGAGQHPGKFMPAVFLASLEKNSIHADNLKKAQENENIDRSFGPQELTQMYRGKNGQLLWGDKSSFTGIYETGAYWGGVFGGQCFDGASGSCYTNSGKKTLPDPHGYIDGPEAKPGDGYMGISLGVMRSMAGLMCAMPQIRSIINYDNLLEFTDRVANYGLITANDPCVTPDSREATSTCDAYRSQNCKYYKVTWGPDPNNPGDCIKTPTPPYTKVGRFTYLDGMKIGYVYKSLQIENNWAALRAMCNVQTPPTPTYNRGDVDHNGSISSSDALLVLRKSLGLSMVGTAWYESATTGDVDCNGSITASDSLLILRKSLGLSMTGTSWCGN